MKIIEKVVHGDSSALYRVRPLSEIKFIVYPRKVVVGRPMSPITTNI